MNAIGTRLKSAVRGAFWLVRANGLRAMLHGLEQQLDELESAAVPPAPPREPGDSPRADYLRWLSLGDLRAFERKVYSQNGEDGILEEIFRRIGPGTKYFVEFGVETGAECNCARLVREGGWRGLFLEADPGLYARLAERYRPFPGVRCTRACVRSDNIEGLLAEAGVPEEFDLLSIDIDGNDYWVWQAIHRWRPRVVVIEYNAAYPPPRKWVMRENPAHVWRNNTYYGASLASLSSLGRKKGYSLVATNSTGVNAFFVRDDVAGDHFLDPSACWHYSPPRFHRGGGHPPGDGPFEEV
jgi:hypothetical protein